MEPGHREKRRLLIGLSFFHPFHNTTAPPGDNIRSRLTRDPDSTDKSKDPSKRVDGGPGGVKGKQFGGLLYRT